MPPKKVEEEEEQKYIPVPRAVTNAEMLNLISDKLDALLLKQEDLLKIAKED